MIVYTDKPDDVTAEQLHGFFVGWPNPPSPETHLELLVKSDEIVLAMDDETGNVVGFINAITDHLMSAYIPLLEVLPEYRKRGIGSELVRRMLEKFSGLYMIDLMCDVERQPFYERLGMRTATGMMIRDFKNQAGRAS
jgi:ribosomal protein S18 acetylase RimI-like enzyme